MTNTFTESFYHSLRAGWGHGGDQNTKIGLSF